MRWQLLLSIFRAWFVQRIYCTICHLKMCWQLLLSIVCMIYTEGEDAQHLDTPGIYFTAVTVYKYHQV